MCYNPFSLANKSILITGASSGIGRATAIECSKMGAHCIVTGRDEDRLNDTFEHLSGSNHIIITADLTKPDDIDLIVSSIQPIDGLANAAGVGMTLPLQFSTIEKNKQIFDVNYFAPVELTRALIKKKKILRGGSVVFVSSVDGPMVTHLGNSAYSATKAALLSATKSIALELSGKGIRVNAVLPGMTNTPLISNGLISEEQMQIELKNYPLGRCGDPNEIANGIIYFLSDASSFSTGSSLVIDGGFTLL